ncbi:MAG TPA: paraquat-inducible protein A [Tepidisphaeraceae bacterium]|jgi:paraquat-inducible protein A
MDSPDPTVAIACKTCGQIHALEPLSPNTIAKCRRCGSRLAKRTVGSLHLTAAFSLAALILYVPANIFPILKLDMYGATTENTVWEGCVRLFTDGDYVVAIIVFLASILIPLLKLLGLFFLVATTKLRISRWKIARTWIFRVIDIIGRWAMLDVFVMAVLVSLVKLQRLATIIPGKGLVAFAIVVVFTIFASASFDPKLIWEHEEAEI